MRPSPRSVALVMSLATLSACVGDGNPFADGPPSIVVQLNNTSGSVSVGNPFQVIATSQASQPGQPTFDLTGLPSGVTFTANPPLQASPSRYVWTVSIEADGTAAPGTTAITFSSSRSGGQGTADFQLTVN